MDKVLTDLLGAKVSRVIMNRVTRELHNPNPPSVGVLAPEISLETASSRPLPKRLSY